MKTLVAIVITMSLIIVPSLSFAKNEKKGPQSEKAYEHADENASFKRGEDFEGTGKGKQKHKNLEDEKQRKKEKKSKEAKLKDDESKLDDKDSKGGNTKVKSSKSKKNND